MVLEQLLDRVKGDEFHLYDISCIETCDKRMQFYPYPKNFQLSPTFLGDTLWRSYFALSISDRLKHILNLCRNYEEVEASKVRLFEHFGYDEEIEKSDITISDIITHYYMMTGGLVIGDDRTITLKPATLFDVCVIHYDEVIVSREELEKYPQVTMMPFMGTVDEIEISPEVLDDAEDEIIDLSISNRRHCLKHYKVPILNMSFIPDNENKIRDIKLTIGKRMEER